MSYLPDMQEKLLRLNNRSTSADHMGPPVLTVIIMQHRCLLERCHSKQVWKSERCIPNVMDGS